MKRYLMTILAAVLTTLTLKAMPYEMAREEAMYLTDKMAYELNLNQRQYEYAYEINLDYLMGLDRAEDAYGILLRFRNDDLRHILYDWQWNIFAHVDYFLHPVSWRYGHWYYPIYTHYARNYYYYSRPAVYHNYRGTHSHAYHDRGYYSDRRPRWDGGFRGNDKGHVAPGRGHGETQFGGTRPGGIIPGGHPNMGGMNQGNRPDMNQGNRPNMGDMNQGNRPNMGATNQNTQQPNMGGNRGNTGLSSQRGNATATPSRGHAETGVSRGNANMGNVRSNPGMGNTRGNANAGSNPGNARGNAGRGAR